MTINLYPNSEDLQRNNSPGFEHWHREASEAPEPWPEKISILSEPQASDL